MNQRPEVSAVLEQFAHAGDVTALSRGVTALIKAKKVLFEALGDPRFQAGIGRLATEARGGPNEVDRLKAISTLARLRVVLRTKGDSIEQLLRPALDVPLPSAQCLADGDDRYYVALALPMTNAEWALSYCAREIVAEQNAENARNAFAGLLLERAATIEDAFHQLESNWVAFTPPEDNVANAVCRRLRRIFQALSHSLVGKQFREAGLLGQASRRFISSALSGQKEPDNLTILRDLGNAVAAFLDSAVRVRLSLLLDSSIYEPIKLCRRWFPLSSWPSFVGRSKEFGRLVATLTQAILLSVKQRVFDRGLLDALELCAGSRDSANKVTKALASENPGLDTDAQVWLQTWRTPGSDTARHHETSFDVDHYLATAFLEACSLRQRAATGDAQSLVSSVMALADARGLATFGEVGSEASFAVDLHAPVGDLTGTRRIRIIRPGVEQKSATGVRRVLIKAIVESVLATQRQ